MGGYLDTDTKGTDMTLTLDTQSCAILADKGSLGRHSRQDLAAKLRGMGRTGHVVVVDAGDGQKVLALRLTEGGE